MSNVICICIPLSKPRGGLDMVGARGGEARR